VETRKFEITEIRADTRTAEAVLSTEFPVRRFDGEEILSHSPGSVDLTREPLPVLQNHDGQSLPCGVAENLRLEDNKLKATLRFSRNADALWQDIQDKIVRSLSVGYQILKRTKTKAGYLATSWQPFEVSIVGAPADPMAGIGRKLTIGGYKMDKNDLLKERKRATDEMISIAGQSDLSSETKEKFDRIKEGIEGIDRRLEVLDDIEKVKKPEFVPDAGTEKRDISFEGGPAQDASYRSLFGEPVYDEEEINQFRTQLTNLPSGGGFSVPAPMSSAWLTESLPNEVIRPRATNYPMSSESLTIPGWDWADMSSDKCFGGFEMEWVAETGTATAQTAQMRQIQLNARKGAIHCDCSREITESGQGFVAHLERALKKSIAYGLDDVFFNGITSPLGITNDVARIEVDKEIGQTSEVDFLNISKMYARMYAGGRNNCVWLASDQMLPFLLTGLSVAIGVSGSWVNIFSDKNGEFNLLGKRVLFTPHLPAPKTANSLMLVDLKEFAIGINSNLRLERSNIPQWREDMISFRLYTRLDSMGTWNAVYQPANSGDSQSWCVGLGAI